MKKYLCIALILALLTSAACGEVDPVDTDAPDPGTSTESTQPPESTTADLTAELPTGDYGGYVFKMLGPKSDQYHYAIMTAEEQNGEPVNDAVYKRNTKVSEKLNVTFSYEERGAGSAAGALRTSVLAGDNAYDAVFEQIHTLGPVAADGFMLDLHLLDKLDLDKPWWDRNVANEFELAGKLFALQGDLHYHSLYNMWSLFFNAQLVEDNKLGDPYQLVFDGKWTADKLIEYCRAVMRDVDGDGLYTVALDNEDICGVVSNSSSYFALLHGMGESLITKNKSGVPEFKGLTERFNNVYENMLKICGSNGVFSTYGSLSNPERFGLFASDRYLFSLMMLGSSKDLREMPNDFGILPMPKYDESQEKYYSYVGPSVMNLCVPANAEDLDRTGTIIENLAGYSHGAIREAYLETTIQSKLMRDENSARIINDYIFNNVTVELGYIYKFASIHDKFTNAIGNEEGIASVFAANTDAVKTAISEYLKKLAD